jgi:hypothetical protein
VTAAAFPSTMVELVGRWAIVPVSLFFVRRGSAQTGKTERPSGV